MKIRQEASRYAMLVLGAAILAFGLYNVHSQSHITEGGVLGMTLLLEHWLGVSPAISEVVLDGICYALGLRYLGKAFLPHALAATSCFALFYALNEHIGPVLPNLGGMPLVAAAVGGVFVGVGVGLVVRAGGAAGGDDALALVISKNRQRAAEAAAAASAAAASEAAAKAAEEEAARAASEAAEAARQEEERLAAEAAAAKRAEQVTAAQAEHDSVQYGDKLGRIWVEGTNVDCALYWGDSEGQFGRGAGCRAESDCVLPGENGTVFIGGHTGTYFSDLGSTQLGAIIHLETDWGDFTYKVTDMQVIQETDVDKVRWGAEEPSCILYTCYPFGILTHTPQRYAVYADPVSADEYGVVPAETTEK